MLGLHNKRAFVTGAFSDRGRHFAMNWEKL